MIPLKVITEEFERARQNLPARIGGEVVTVDDEVRLRLSSVGSDRVATVVTHPLSVWVELGLDNGFFGVAMIFEDAEVKDLREGVGQMVDAGARYVAGSGQMIRSTSRFEKDVFVIEGASGHVELRPPQSWPFTVMEVVTLSVRRLRDRLRPG